MSERLVRIMTGLIALTLAASLIVFGVLVGAGKLAPAPFRSWHAPDVNGAAISPASATMTRVFTVNSSGGFGCAEAGGAVSRFRHDGV